MPGSQNHSPQPVLFLQRLKAKGSGCPSFQPLCSRAFCPTPAELPTTLPSVTPVPAPGSSLVLIPVLVLTHWPGQGQWQQVPKALSSLPSVGSQWGTPTVRGTLAQSPLRRLYLLKGPPRKTTGISCDLQPWTLHTDSLNHNRWRTEVSDSGGLDPPVTVSPVSPRRGRCET